jgi:F420-non-reducing hydrogenase small subunit
MSAKSQATPEEAAPASEEKPRLKVAMYWAASCGGCEIGLLAIHEKIVDLFAVADIVFMPVAVDAKYDDVRAMPDGYIDVCLFNGAIRTSENEELAHLLRRKSKVLVAFGSCAQLGGIPGLANQTTREEIFHTVYGENPSLDNPSGVVPQTRTEVPEGELEIPYFYPDVRTLAQTTRVDYFLPGCPPAADQIWAVLELVVRTIVNGEQGLLPPAGSVVGVGERTVCQDCKFEKSEKKIRKFVRPHLTPIDDTRCLLEQGIVCLGPATRQGCGAPCPSHGNMPCRGCYGPPEGVLDQGAKMISALASIIDADDPEEAERIAAEVVDPLGTFYRFALPSSTLRRRVFHE